MKRQKVEKVKRQKVQKQKREEWRKDPRASVQIMPICRNYIQKIKNKSIIRNDECRYTLDDLLCKFGKITGGRDTSRANLIGLFNTHQERICPLGMLLKIDSQFTAGRDPLYQIKLSTEGEEQLKLDLICLRTDSLDCSA